MLRPSRGQLSTLLVALGAGVGGVGVSYATANAVAASPRRWVVAPVARLLTNEAPGEIIAYMIENYGSLGQTMNLLMATSLTIVALAGLAAFGIAIGRKSGVAAFGVVTTIATTWIVVTTLTEAPMISAGAALGSGIVVAIGETAGREIRQVEMEQDRRRVIAGSATAVGLGSVGFGTGFLYGPGPIEREPVDAVDNPGGTIEEDGSYSVDELKQLAQQRSLSVSSIEPLLSKNHYTVDINSIDPNVDRESWTLSVTGDVENELELDFEDIRDLPAENRLVTLRCVGDSLNGKKVDTAVWTGVPVTEILEQANPTTDCDCVMLRAADDFYEEFPLSALEDGLLAYGMNGMTLPRSHGYPLRALVPGHWGEVNVKWLTEIEVLEKEQKGYWEKKGWHGTGPVHTVAKLWDKDGDHRGIIHRDDGTIQLAGHAYAGTRGIQKVEVSTDGGDTWNEAELTEKLPGDDVWRQWSYTYDPPDGDHDVVVRATDGEGNLQKQEQNDAYPRGATGWVSQTVSP